MKERKVMIFGVFDVIHEGHKYFLEKAKKYGDILVCVLATDMNVKKLKGKKPHNSAKKRIKNMGDYADKVMIGDKDDFMMPLMLEMPDIICLGHDQKDYLKNIDKYKKVYKMVKGKSPKIARIKSHKRNLFKSSKILKKDSLKGKVISGFDEGKKYVEIYTEKIHKKFGFEPFPGTLNLKVKVDEKRRFIRDAKEEIIEGFNSEDRFYHEIKCYRIRFSDGKKGIIIVPKRTRHKTSIIEIVAEFDMRETYNLKDGDIFEIKK